MASNIQSTGGRGSADIKSQLLTGSASDNISVNKLEKHLADYRTGNGNLSKDTAASIFSKNDLNGSFLANNYPKLLASYAGYVTGMRYDERSRFIKGVNSANDTLELVHSAQTSGPTAKEIEDLYKPSPPSGSPTRTVA